MNARLATGPSGSGRCWATALGSIPPRALPEFEAYLKADPENAIAKTFVADIQSGKEPAHVIRHEATENQ
jgi:hypothetical protein